MKSNSYFLILAILPLLSSCNNDDDETSNPSAPVGCIIAKVDGNNWLSPSQFSSFQLTDSTFLLEGTQHVGQETHTIRFTIYNFMSPGLYTGGMLSAQYIISDTSGNSQVWYKNRGLTEGYTEIRLNTLDTIAAKASGTFKFTAPGTNGITSTKTVSDGIFNAVEQE